MTILGGIVPADSSGAQTARIMLWYEKLPARPAAAYRGVQAAESRLADRGRRGRAEAASRGFGRPGGGVRGLVQTVPEQPVHQCCDGKSVRPNAPQNRGTRAGQPSL